MEVLPHFHTYILFREIRMQALCRSALKITHQPLCAPNLRGTTSQIGLMRSVRLSSVAAGLRLMEDYGSGIGWTGRNSR